MPRLTCFASNEVPIAQKFCLPVGEKHGISALWGVQGELFNAAGKLRDWSRAGYRAGEAPIPRPMTSSDLMKDWDAAGDGITDDTEVGGMLDKCTLHLLYTDKFVFQRLEPQQSTFP